MPSAVSRDVVVRRLSATDLPAVARIHCGAFKKSALTRFGLETVERFYSWQLRETRAHALGVDVAESGLAAFCFAGVFADAFAGFMRENKRFLASRVARRPWLVATPLVLKRIGRGLRILSRPQPPPSAPQPCERAFDILAIGVDPQYQRRGFGRLLMDEAQELAQRNGFRLMTLFVNRDNVQAQRFYERLGWQKTIERGAWRGCMTKRVA